MRRTEKLAGKLEKEQERAEKIRRKKEAKRAAREEKRRKKEEENVNCRERIGNLYRIRQR